MFDLEIICTNEKDKKIESKDNNDLLQNIEANIKLYKVNSNELSLTNIIETFRFLPINRKKSLFLLN